MGDGIKHLITLATGIFKGGGEGRGQPPALALPGAVSAARCGLHKGRPRPPRGIVAGGGRAPGPRSCQTWVGRSEGGPAARARSWAARGGPGGSRSHPLFANGRLPGRGERRALRSGSIRLGPSAAGLVHKAPRPRTGRSQVGLRSPRRAAGSSGRTGADGRSRPPLRPFPFAFIRGDKSAVRQPAFQFTDNDSCMKIDRGGSPPPRALASRSPAPAGCAPASSSSSAPSSPPPPSESVVGRRAGR